MRAAFTGIVIVSIICAVVHMIMAARHKGRLCSQIIAIQGAAVISALLYLPTLYLENEAAETLMIGLFYASIDWILFLILDFILCFTGVSRKSRSAIVMASLYCSVAFLDLLSLCINPFLGNAFTLFRTPAGSTLIRPWTVEPGLFYRIHLGFCYLLAANIFAELIRKALKSPKDYRVPYLWTLFVVFLVLILNLLQTYLGLSANYSVWIYLWFSVWVYYFAEYITPMEVENSMQIFVARELDSAIACFDYENHCIRANRAARELFGIRGNDLSPIEQYTAVWRYVNPTVSEDCVSGEDIFEINGKEHIFTQEFRRLRDVTGKIQGSYLKMDDRTDEIRRLNEQRYRAMHDPLTGLYNRNVFFEEAAKIIRKNPEVPRYMVATNIRDFKLINDLFGTEFADDILKKQAQMLSRAEYDGCIHGRIGADRFGMLIAKADYKPELARKNTGTVKELANGTQYHIHMQSGVYEISNPNENVQLMYDRAIMAMQKLRDENDFIAYYDTAMMDELIHKKNVLSEFDRALEEGQFVMFLQPQIDRDGRVVGAEALARWKHPEKGLIPPYQFIPILEETGYIYRLDRYIWELAARKLREWQKLGRTDLGISVNISTRDFYYADLFATFTGLVQQYGIDPALLKLEITETALLYGADHPRILENLSEYGFWIEMDDFGSGYSSLKLLKNTKMDVLKVDMEFLRRTENTERARNIIESIISMAKELGMLVITEGVEEEDQVRFLKGAGCDIFQGYYYSKPIPVAEFEEQYMGRGKA